MFCMLLKSNHTTFLVKFGNNFIHSCVLQKAQIAFVLQAHAILTYFEKPTRENYFQIELEVV